MSEEEVVRRPPATREAIEAFEHRHGVRLPSDMRAFYLEQNGLEIPGGLFQVLAIEEIELADLSPYGSFFQVAEWSVYAQVWFVRLYSKTDTPAPVYDVDYCTPRMWSSSFRDFVDEILAVGFWNVQGAHAEERPAAIRLEHGNPRVIPQRGRVLRFTNEAEDSDLSSIDGFPDALWLDLRGTQITDEGLARLERLPELLGLDLGETSIGDVGLAHVAVCTRLHMLDLGETRVTNAGLVHLAPISWLYSLCLDRTAVTEAGLAALAALDRLSSLSLRATALTETALPTLAHLGPPRTVDLRDTRIGDAAKRAFLERYPNVILDGESHLRPHSPKS